MPLKKIVVMQDDGSSAQGYFVPDGGENAPADGQKTSKQILDDRKLKRIALIVGTLASLGTLFVLIGVMRPRNKN